MKSRVFWVVTQCSSETARYFVRICRSHLQDLSIQSSHPCENLKSRIFPVCLQSNTSERGAISAQGFPFCSLQFEMKKTATGDF